MIVAGITSSITHQVATHGVYAVFVLMAIDAVFPAASELVMLYAGAIAAGAFSDNVSLFGAHIPTGAAAYVTLAAAGTLGYLAGGLVGWWVGRRGGRPFLERHGRALHLDADRLDRAERWFARWGALGVLIGRITPVVRSFISIPAGILEMPLTPYAALTLLGSAVWAFTLAGVGWALGARYDNFDHGFKYAEYAVVLVVCAAAALLVVRALRPSPREG